MRKKPDLHASVQQIDSLRDFEITSGSIIERLEIGKTLEEHNL
jgi:hypothetical protein